MNALYDGVLVADKKKVVKYVNTSYTRITGVKSEEIVGKKLRDIRPGARLPDVISNGKKRLRVPRKENGSEYIVNMCPIKNDEGIIGGISIVRDISDVRKLQEELKHSNMILKKYKNHVKNMHRAKYHFRDIISEDNSSQNIKKMAKKFSKSDSTLLIKGESGTGKELFAQAIHNNSKRKNGPFIAVNCATLNSQLLESELFGYEEGTFTGAKKGGKLGMFEAANTGTIFLDEVTEISYDLQAKLLRTLQEGTIRRVGGVKEISIDIRVISATNKDIEILSKDNKFREDLFYRLNVIPLNIPPLRERKDDIEPLTKYFLDQIQRKFKRSIKMTQEALNAFNSYEWPGNVRELKNALKFATNVMEDYTIKVDCLPQNIQSSYQIAAKEDKVGVSKLNEVINKIEKREINKALKKFGHTVAGKKKAARALGISLATLYNKLKE